MIVCFGSINLDLIFPLPHLPREGETVLGRTLRLAPGGKGANQAVGAARDGATVLFAGAVGTDALAAQALATLQAAGVDLSRVRHLADAATGAAAICVDTAGRNQIAVAAGANLLATADQVEPALLTPATTLLLQGECDLDQTAQLIFCARAAGGRIVLNLAPAAALDPAALRAVNVLVVNEEEGAWLGRHLGTAGSAAALHAALAGPGVVVTHGGDGIDVCAPDAAFRLPAHKVEVVDTTAAGDCFCGVLAAGLDCGLTLVAALRRANVAAALACARPGSQDSLPTAAQTDRALADAG